MDYFHLNHTESDIDYFVEEKKMPDGFERGIRQAVHDIEKKTELTFGSGSDGKMPLFLAIRAGAAVPMPGYVS